MIDSPYFTGSAPNFGPPSGMAGLIQQDRAIASSGQAGWQQFADIAEKYKQQQLEGKAADATVAAYPDLLAATGIHPEQWKTLGAREKSSAVRGAIQGQAQQSFMQQMAEVAQRQRAQQQQLEANQALAQFAQDYGTGDVVSQVQKSQALPESGTGPGTPRSQIDPRLLQPTDMERFAALAQTPQDRLQFALRRNPKAIISPQFDNSIRAIEAGTRGTAGQPSIMELQDSSGNKYPVAWSPTTGKFDVLPSPNRPPNITIPDGLQVPKGYVAVPTGKGGFRYLKEDSNPIAEMMQSSARSIMAQLQSMKQRGVKKVSVDSKSGTVSPADGLFSFGGQNVDDVIASIKSSLPDTASAAPPTTESLAGGAATVTTKEQFDKLPAGSTYIGKDGKTYRKP